MRPASDEDDFTRALYEIGRRLAVEEAKQALGIPPCHVIHEMMSLMQHCLTCKHKWPDETEHQCPLEEAR